MQRDTVNRDSWSLTKAFKKANNSILRVAGLSGVIFWGFSLSAIGKEAALNPDATILGGVGSFYENWVNALPEAADGAMFIVDQAFNTAASIAAEFVIPGSGAVMEMMSFG